MSEMCDGIIYDSENFSTEDIKSGTIAKAGGAEVSFEDEPLTLDCYCAMFGSTKGWSASIRYCYGSWMEESE